MTKKNDVLSAKKPCKMSLNPVSAILMMYWRKDVEFERCYSLGQTVRDSDMANFMNTSYGKLLNNKFVN